MPDLTFQVDLLAAINEEITLDEKATLFHLLDKYDDVFSKGEYDLHSTNLVTHTIDTGYHTPIKQPPRRHPLPLLQAIREQTAEMLHQDLIEL